MSRYDQPDEIHSLQTIEDDGLIYEQMLREEAGVETKMDVYPGLSHDFWGVDTHLESSKKQWLAGVEGAKWLLGMEGSR